MKTKEEEAMEILAETISNLIKNNNSDMIDSLPFDRTYVGRIISYKGNGKYEVEINENTYILPYLVGEDWEMNKEKLQLSLQHSHLVPNFLRSPVILMDAGIQTDLLDAIEDMGYYYSTSPPTYVYENIKRKAHGYNEPYYWRTADLHWKSDDTRTAYYTESDSTLGDYNPTPAWTSTKSTIDNNVDIPKDMIVRSGEAFPVNTKVIVKAPQNNKSNMYIEGRLSA